MNYTCKLPILCSENLCTLNTEWTDQGDVNLLLLHEDNAWEGKFQIEENEEINQLMVNCSMTLDVFADETKKALTTHGGADNFVYAIENEKFIWKKLIGKNMTVKFGFIDISKLPASTVSDKVIDKVLHSLVDTNLRLDGMCKRIEALEKDNLQLKSKLDTVIIEKREMESTLYHQFLSLLNQKKTKIVELKQQLDRPANQAYDDDSDTYYSGSDKDFKLGSDIGSEDDSHMDRSSSCVKRGGKHKFKYNTTCILPKRTKQPSKFLSVAGPSGSSHPASNNTLLKPQIDSKTSRVGEVCDSNTEEEKNSFIFPKRPKKCNNIKTRKPDNTDYYMSDDDSDATQAKVGLLERSQDRFTVLKSEVKPESSRFDHNQAEEESNTFVFPKQRKRPNNTITPKSDTIYYSDDD